MSKWIKRDVLGSSTTEVYRSCISKDGLVMYLADMGNFKILKSVNSGASWTDITPVGLTKSSRVVCDNDGSVVVVGEVDSGRIYISTDSGSNWTKRDPIDDNNYNWFGLFCNNNGSIIYAIPENTGNKVYKTTDYGATWTEITFNPTGTLGRKYVSGSDNGNVIYLSLAEYGRVYFSTDGGTNWTNVLLANNVGFICSSSDGSITYVVGVNDIFKTSDSGANWGSVANHIEGINYAVATVDCSYNGSIVIYATSKTTTEIGRVFKSTDGGSNWAEEQPAGNIDAVYWTTITISDDGNKALLGGAYNANWVYTYIPSLKSIAFKTGGLRKLNVI
jgi:photosystem II stability/assembly factor-like uncharacterized protein